MEIRDARTAHRYRLRKLRNQVGRDNQTVCIDTDAAVLEVVDERIGALVPLRDAEITLQRGSLKRGDVLHIGVTAGDGAGEAGMAEKLRVVEAEFGDGFEQAVGGMQGKRVLRAAQVDARYIERDARAGPGFAVLGGGARGSGLERLTGDEAGLVQLRLKAEAVGDIPALGFRELDEHILLRGIPGGVLHGRVDFVKEGKVVEIALGLQQGSLVKRVAGMHQNAVFDQRRPRVIEAGEHDAPDGDLLPFHDVQRDVSAGLVGRLDVLFHLNLGMIEAVRDEVAE